MLFAYNRLVNRFIYSFYFENEISQLLNGNVISIHAISLYRKGCSFENETHNLMLLEDKIIINKAYSFCCPGIHIFYTFGSCNHWKRYLINIEWIENGHLSIEYRCYPINMGSTYREWFENGKLKKEYNYKNGYKYVYRRKKKFKYGTLHGKYRKWYSNGNLKCDFIYKDGLKHGLFQKFYRNGQLKEEFTCARNVRNGLYRCWYKNGQPNSVYTALNGKVDKLFMQWSSSGRLVRKILYNNNKIVCRYNLYDKNNTRTYYIINY